MILSDKTIMKMLDEGTLEISPLSDGQIQPASVDIRLGNTFSIVEDFSTGIITMENEKNTRPSKPTHTSCCPVSSCWQPPWSILLCPMI